MGAAARRFLGLLPVGEVQGLHLGADAELRGLQGVGRGHGVLGAVQAVQDEPAEEGEARPAGGVEFVLARAVHQEEEVFLRAAGKSVAP